jgi:iduronate 2-sulfatase
VTMPEFFVQHNYSTLGHGKLYHPSHPPNYDLPRSWSQTQQYWPSTNSGCKNDLEAGLFGSRYCPDGTSDPSDFSDVNVTGHALDTLAMNAAAYKANPDANFALFLGLHFPHQSWYVPEWASKKYSPISGTAPPKHPYAPKGASPVGFTAGARAGVVRDV